MLLLTEGHLGIFSSKTAASLIRYCPDEVAGVVDSHFAGRCAGEILGIGDGVPIFANVKDALLARPDTLVIGVAPVGGGLEPAWRAIVLDALRAGLNIVAGLHVALGSDGELAAAAKASGVRIFDVRESPPDIPVATMRATEVRAFRVLTIGTDCNSGKMVAALELTRAAREAGLDARFIATGQTGIMISGKGIAIDHVVSDFTAGAAERIVLDDGDADIVFIEGQGSIVHPGYSGVTLSLMHGSLPHAMVLVHAAGRRVVRKFPREVKLPTLSEMIESSESLMRPIFPSRVVAVALNTLGLSDEDARRALVDAERETGLPAGDVIRNGCGPVWNRVKEAYDEASHRNLEARPHSSV
jgi:uncharacterized NAD-dependent epimerase/dehydratase family protein